MNLPAIPLGVLLAGIWLILKGASVHTSTGLTLIFGIVIAVLAVVALLPIVTTRREV